MTISYPAFKEPLEENEISAYWNSDGTILIICRDPQAFKSDPDKNKMKSWGVGINLQPAEIEDILKTGEFHFEGVRPGLIPMREKINVTTVDGTVTINSQTFMFGDGLDPKSLAIPKKMLADILKACKKMWEGKRTLIRPLIGLNSKAKSFDGLAGTLDQDKKNEEQRVLAKEFLKNR